MSDERGRPREESRAALFRALRSWLDRPRERGARLHLELDLDQAIELERLIFSAADSERLYRLEEQLRLARRQEDALAVLESELGWKKRPRGGVRKRYPEELLWAYYGEFLRQCAPDGRFDPKRFDPEKATRAIAERPAFDFTNPDDARCALWRCKVLLEDPSSELAKALPRELRDQWLRDLRFHGSTLP